LRLPAGTAAAFDGGMAKSTTLKVSKFLSQQHFKSATLQMSNGSRSAMWSVVGSLSGRDVGAPHSNNLHSNKTALPLGAPLGNSRPDQ
jgi:hypothetical protein